MNDMEIQVLRHELNRIREEVLAYFDRHSNKAEALFPGGIHKGYWEKMEDEEKLAAESLAAELIRVMGKLSLYVKNAILLDESDLREVALSTKQMRSAIYFRQYSHWDVEPIDDGGYILGVKPAGQSEESVYFIKEAKRAYINAHINVSRIIDLITDGGGEFLAQPNVTSHQVTKYRPNTAFIMMWMDKTRPELDDVRDTIKTVFASFGVRAVRADDIEHEDVITKRILDEISTSEFLIADLTGERPSVYYEVGFAHALGRRVILYRRKETTLHFDLAVHNCPEYENLGDLKSKLQKRLRQLTNENPK